MSESVQNQYFQGYNLFGHDSEQEFGINHFFPVEDFYLHEFSQPFNRDQLDHFYAAQPCKDFILPTQTQTKPVSDIKKQISAEVEMANCNIQFETNIFQKYKTVFKGTKDDTVQLNINFKTIIAHFLKELTIANELNEFQLKKFQQFIKRVPSFKSLKELFAFSEQNQRLRQVCLQFVESGKCMRRVLSSKCGLKTKLQMVKYVQKLGVNIKTKEIVKWKDELKQKQIQ